MHRISNSLFMRNFNVTFLSRPLSNSVRSYESKPVHRVHYETSLHQKDDVSRKDEKSLPDSADVVVIGGGSVGCSTAYHLAKFNAGKVVLLEKDRLTAGTSWHTAGIFWDLRDGKALTQMQVQTRHLLSDILPKETGFDSGWIETGALFITRDVDQMDGLEKKRLIGIECGAVSRIVDPKEISEIHPLMNTEGIVGGIYLPHGGSLDPATLCTSYVKAATKYGAEVFENCEVKNIETSQGVLGLRKVSAVETNLGTIKTNYVLNCTGAWAPYIAKMVGVNVPQLTYKHAYVVTQGIPGAEKTPHFRDTENYLYCKRQGDSLLFGGYEKDPELVGVPEKDFAFGLYDMNWELFEVHMKAAIEVIPSIAKVGIRSTVCGPESFTPDSRPIMGESPDVKGFFLGSGFNSGGMMMGGGAGRQLAHWVVHGAPEYDMHECDVNRFTRKYDETCLIEWCHDSFTTRYDVHHPYSQKLGGRNLRTTPLTQIHTENGAYFNSVHGWEVPMYFMSDRRLPLLGYDYFGFYGKTKHAIYEYRDHLAKDASFERNSEIEDQIVKESLACHETSAVIDLSHLSKFSFSGPNVNEVLKALFSTDVTTLNENSLTNTLMLDKSGVIVAYVSVFKSDDGSYLISAASELQDFILRHINQFLLNGDLDCEFRDVTDEYALLNVVGPKSKDLLKSVLPDFPDDLQPSHGARCKFNNVEIKVKRLLHDEILMHEVVCPMKEVLTLYEYLTKSKINSVPAGIRALTSVLLEKGCLSRLSRGLAGTTPLEAGVMDLCPEDGDRDYLGKDAFSKMRSNPQRAKIVHLTANSDFAIFPGDMIWKDGVYVGTIDDVGYGCKSGNYHMMGCLKSPPGGQVMDEFISSGNFKVGRWSTKTDATLADH